MTKKSALATLCTLLLGLALVGCGKGSDTGKTDQSQTSTQAESAPEEEFIEPEATLSPADIDSGYVPEDAYHAAQPWNDEYRTSDIWWKDGQEGTEGIFLTNAGNDAGKAVTWVDGDGYETDTQFEMTITEDNHLASKPGEEPAIDLVFNDHLTCFDSVSGTWYVRGDADELNALLAELSVTTEDGRWSIMFAEGGTFSDVYDDEESTGTWEFISSCNIRLTYDSGLDPEVLDVVRNEDGQVIELSNTWNQLFVQ